MKQLYITTEELSIPWDRRNYITRMWRFVLSDRVRFGALRDCEPCECGNLYVERCTFGRVRAIANLTANAPICTLGMLQFGILAEVCFGSGPGAVTGTVRGTVTGTV